MKASRFTKSLTVLGLVVAFCATSQASGAIVHNTINHSIVWAPDEPATENRENASIESYSISFPVYSESPVNLDPPMILFNLKGSRTFGAWPNLPIQNGGYDSFETVAARWLEIPGCPDNGHAVFKSTAGTPIGPALFSQIGADKLFTESWGTDLNTGNVYLYGQAGLYGVTPGIMPFRMNLFGTYYYGWIRTSVHRYYSTAPNGKQWLHSATLNIYDYAYETTPNTSLLAGAVPEPATLGMLMVGGLAILRRRK